MQHTRQNCDSSLLRSKIMIVDDDPLNVQIVSRMLDWGGYTKVSSTCDSTKAMDLFRELDPDLILVDLLMPGLSGVELIRMIRAESETTFVPILVFTADTSKEARKSALDAGACDFILKPGDTQEILLRVHNFLQMRMLYRGLGNENHTLEDMVRARTAELERSQREIVHRLAKAAEYRDDDTGEHTVRVGELSAALAHELKMSDFEVELIRLAAPLHDIGKVAVPDRVLRKDGDLTPDEFDLVKRHVEVGVAILANGESAVVKMAERIVAYHHEHFDGNGYPNGTKGSAIPLAARIVAVVDAYDALTHNRPHRKAVPKGEALTTLWKCAGSQFDPKVVEALEQLVKAKGCPTEPVAEECAA